jgi:hypothetical protein
MLYNFFLFLLLILFFFISAYIVCLSTRSGAGVAQSVQRLTTDWTTGVWSLADASDFSSSLACVQTSSEAHTASYPMGTGGSFPGSKVWPEHHPDHSPPSSAKVKNEKGLYLLPPLVDFMPVAGQLLLLSTGSTYIKSVS